MGAVDAVSIFGVADDSDVYISRSVIGLKYTWSYSLQLFRYTLFGCAHFRSYRDKSRFFCKGLGEKYSSSTFIFYLRSCNKAAFPSFREDASSLGLISIFSVLEHEKYSFMETRRWRV